jgi:galactonate dehydratase
MPDPRPLQIRDLRVTRRPVNHRGDWVFVELTDSDGRRGFGEASHSGDDEAVVGLLSATMGAQVRSTAWAEPSEAWRALDGVTPPGTPRRVSATAASAVEQALWDLAAQREGVGLAALLGASESTAAPERVAVPLYANINRATVDRSPAGFAASATQAVRDGFRIIKLAPFDEVAYGTAAGAHRRLAEPGIARVAAVREAVGADVRVLVDCHWRFDVASALEVAGALARLDVGWLEDPVPHEDGPDDVSAVRRSAPLPIATGERLISAAAFEPFLAADAADYYLPDIKHIGGIGELLKLARASRDSGARITPHNPSGPISTLASACALAGVAHAAPLEFAWGEVPWRPAVLTPPERIEDGALVLPVDRPGLGARLSRVT